MVLEMEMSKTYQYRKVMKPMLERKRRARINKCLDELKEIMVECLTQEGEHITRLEKADILELTVEHMKKLKQQKQLRITQEPLKTAASVTESFKAGYVHAANEVSKALASLPGVSVDLGTQLMSHLGHRLNYLQIVVPTAAIAAATGTGTVKPLFGPMIAGQTMSPAAGTATFPSAFYDESTNHRLATTITPPPSECCSDRSNSPTPSESSSVWRPW